jgi:tetratricopeptide (TPR) repeat protein
MRQFGLVLVATLLVAGCATVRPHEVARPSTPASTRPAPVPPAGEEGLSSYIQKIRALSLQARPARVELDTVERRYPGLAEALADVSANPTAENRRLAGDAYRAANILDQAYGQYAQASRLDPRNAAAWDGMARIWRDWGFPNLALPDASRAVFHAPESAAVHNTLGTVLHALNRAREARAEFERALALDRQASYALNNLCYSWLSEGNGTVAAETCQLALALAPDLSPARNNLALAYAVQGDLKSAEREFASAGNPAAREYNLGIVYMGQRRFSAAAAAFTRAAALQPGLHLVAERARQAWRLAAANPNAEDDDGRR